MCKLGLLWLQCILVKKLCLFAGITCQACFARGFGEEFEVFYRWNSELRSDLFPETQMIVWNQNMSVM